MSAEATPDRLGELIHELSQPLTAARCSLELGLQLPADSAERESFLQDAAAALERLAQLTRRLRDWAEREATSKNKQ